MSTLRMFRVFSAAALLSAFVVNLSTDAFAANTLKRKKSNVSRMVMLGICIDQVLMQQNIQLQLPPINQRPNWDVATRSAVVQAALQCKAQMRASATIQTALPTNSSGLIIMPPLPSSTSSNIASPAPMNPPQGPVVLTPPPGTLSPEIGVTAEAVPGDSQSEPTAMPPGVEQAPPSM